MGVGPHGHLLGNLQREGSTHIVLQREVYSGSKPFCQSAVQLLKKFTKERKKDEYIVNPPVGLDHWYGFGKIGDPDTYGVADKAVKHPKRFNTNQINTMRGASYLQ